ncbi:hypothetical protein DAEQUDRAFT_271030 [Daedalea quercina L-15889]|uniref:Semialdehyde dehydrogenase NAD-binding domain-containing protein n=1 Tax=Daedalea quercina L-15889 TaxID=1314783 RepID=A0A165QCE5_9APHY|nr:hypothetical protein DAEQUDRAFT_271030 [Daedalea quercina L-15889]
MAGLSALILGATGATGKVLLQELLASPKFSSVSEYGRHVTAPEKVAAGKDKLEQKTIDFEKLDDAGLKDKKWDVVFITLGTTRKNAGSAEAFEKIDRDGGANANSPFLYMKSKGKTELALADLGYSDTVIFRPAALGDADRNEHRPLEVYVHAAAKAISTFIPSIYMPVPKLAKAMRVVGEVGSQGVPPERVRKMGSEKAPWSILDNNAILAIADSFN